MIVIDTTYHFYKLLMLYLVLGVTLHSHVLKFRFMSSQIATLSNCLGCILDSSNNPRDKIRVQPINAI